MPAKSKAQARLMAAAEHGAQFPMAQKVRQSMTHNQMRDFAVTPRASLPAHIGMKASMGSHPNASRLGKFLHPKKSR